MSDQLQRQFGPVALAYANSSFHAHGADLARLVAEARFTGSELVLDQGCGAGHTAMACAQLAAGVIGVDVTPQMVEMASSLARERGLSNASFRIGDAESLPFDDTSFDVVTSRVSAHHYSELPCVFRRATGRALFSYEGTGTSTCYDRMSSRNGRRLPC